MSEDNDRTVGDVGEFGLIDLLAQSLPPATTAGSHLVIGIGDDAAVWRPTPREAQVITTDTLVEDIHFKLAWTDWESLGHKMLAVNLSDLAAMGAIPRLAVITLCLRGSERLADLQALYRGVGALAARSGTLIVGGDLARSPAALTLHVTAIGESRRGRVLTRAGARIGDVIAVSGALGAAAAGLQLLALAADDPRRQATTADALIAAHLRPEPRIALGALLVEHSASAAMDLSDGLLGDLPKILAASRVHAWLDAAAIPAPAAIRALFPAEWFDLATRGGEDYELLFTAPPAVFAEIAIAAQAIGATVTAIGKIAEPLPNQPPLVMRTLEGEEIAIAPGAFDHFA